MTNKAITPTPPGDLAPADLLELAGLEANRVAAKAAFEDYRSRKADNTIRRQSADLALFTEFLAEVGIPVGDLENDPEAWRGVTWGLIRTFIEWQMKRGYAITSINGRLSTVKVYARLAAQAGAIPPDELVLIRSVRGYEHKEQKRVNEKRTANGIETRVGHKKAEPVSLTPKQAKALMSQPDTPRGRRDRLLMALMLRLGLRVGEVAALTVDNFKVEAGELHFYRPKVDKEQTHELDADTLSAARAYLTQDAPEAGSVWKARGEGTLDMNTQGITDRAITKRVNKLGARIGIVGLSAHDLRHYWATQAARSGTALDRLQDAGGWNSLAMPGRYIEAAKIANQGVKLE